MFEKHLLYHMGIATDLRRSTEDFARSASSSVCLSARCASVQVLPGSHLRVDPAAEVFTCRRHRGPEGGGSDSCEGGLLVSQQETFFSRVPDEMVMRWRVQQE